MRTIKALVATVTRRAALIEDYAYLRDFGLTMEQAADRLGLTYDNAVGNYERSRGDVPPWPPREHPPANPGRHCGTRLGYMLHQAWQESACPSCLLARYPGLLAEDIPERLTPVPVAARPVPAIDPPRALTAAEAHRHLADLADAIGAPLPWGQPAQVAA